MKYEIYIKETLDKKLKKISKKDKKLLNAVLSKIDEISSTNPHHYKNLRKPLQHLKRVHIESCFVLTFSVNEKLKEIHFEDFNHHDKIYQ